MRCRSLIACVVPFALGCSGAPVESAPPEDGPLKAEIGPIDIAPGEEKTVCVTRRLSNEKDFVITRMAGDLAPGSHHLILYRSTATEPSETPGPCPAFSGVLGGAEQPLMIVQKPHDELAMPEGVGFSIAAHQMIKLEAHYLNTTTSPIAGRATLTLEGIPAAEASALERADLAFWGTTKIDIPPASTADTGVIFRDAIAGTKAFALSTHQHHLGTRMRVWLSAGPGDTSSPPVADSTNWADPPLYRLDPPAAFDGAAGLSYQCEWNNTTAQQVKFGESALEEMCFLWMYYWPSKGFDVCTDELCLGR